MVFRQELIQTKAFKDVVKKTFAQLDLDKDGQIDREELMIGICQVHFKMASKVPGITSKPTKDSITKVMAECDLDRSGGLSLQEFEVFASKWFESQSVIFGSRLLATSAMTMVVLPGAANIMHDAVPPLSFIPRTLFKVMFGIAFKLTVIALKRDD